MDYYLHTITWKLFIAILVMISTNVIKPATSQTPPVMYVERNWRISETEQVGSIIARVRADDEEHDQLQFGLEPLFHGNFGNLNDGGTTNDKLPFRIDPDTGVVYLNESLIGRAGENFFLYITLTDRQLTAKNEVYVNILGKKSNQKLYSSRPPSITQAAQNLSQFLPPFSLLPGVQSIRDQANIGRPPSNNLYPPYNLNPINSAPSARPASSSDGGPAEWSGHRQVPNETLSDNKEEPMDNPSTTRTKLTPVKSGNDDGRLVVTTRKPLGGWTRDNDTSGQAEKSKEGGHEGQGGAYPLRTVVIPAVIAFAVMFAAAGLIVLFLYRKRLCAIGKNLKKKSKAEMAKKSNQSNLSSNLTTDDSRNSMVMQHWSGPTAFGNRYVPWERDNQQLSMATSQLSSSTSGPTGDVDGTGNTQTNSDKWEFPRHRLKFFNILGEGAFGQVWRCEATDIDGVKGVTTVAVKTLKENAAEIEKNDLASELKVMKSLDPHVNVVRFLGCCTDKEPIFVIIEYVNRGKLQTYLRNSRAERHYGNTHGKSNILTSSDLTSFMYQVAKGMEYLTSRGIIHRDLAARNILITDDHTCKVADFGFARDVEQSKIYERKSEGKLPIRWMAIESLYDNIFSVKSDIWSFGILMWEIVTLGSTPYPGTSAADVMKKVRDGYRLEKPEHCRRELYNIMYYTWAKDPQERPSFSEVVQMLDKLLHTEMDYIELERFPDHNYYNILNLSGEKL